MKLYYKHGKHRLFRWNIWIPFTNRRILVSHMRHDKGKGYIPMVFELKYDGKHQQYTLISKVRGE